MRDAGSGDGDGDGVPHGGAGTGADASSLSLAPSGPYAAPPALNGDMFQQETEALKAFLGEWEPEWPLSQVDGAHGSADAVPQQPAAHAPSSRRSAGVSRKKATSSAPAPAKCRTSSNTWWKQQRLNVLELRETTKALALQLQQLQMGRGINSTLPLEDRLRVAGTRVSAKPLAIKTAGTSWKEVARRESLAREMASADNAHLRSMATSQLAEARKLRRALLEMVKIDRASKTLMIPRRHLNLEAQGAPQDNSAVFSRLLGGLDDSYANADKILAASEISKLPCPGKDSRMWMEESQGLLARILDRYRMPFTHEIASRAIWEAMSGRGARKNSRVLYAESFNYDANTVLISQRTIYPTEPQEVVLLSRVANRKYVESGRTVYIGHMFMVVTQDDRFSVTSDNITIRVFERGELQTHILATHPDVESIRQFSAESLRKYEKEVARFKHKVEDIALANASRSAA